MSSSLTPLPVERPSLRLSSACPIPPDDWRDGEIAAPAVDTGLEAALRTHGGALLGSGRRQAGPDEASDLVQEVFARAAGSKQRHRLINPGGFLRRIAQNLLIDRARRRRNHPALHLPLLEDCDAPSPPEQEWNLEAADLLRLYETAVDAMPAKTRRVFLMHRVDELSYREIHELLGISVATVEYHMMKALGHISRAVEGGR